MAFITTTNIDNNHYVSNISMICGRIKVGCASLSSYLLKSKEDVEPMLQKIRFSSEDEYLSIKGLTLTPGFRKAVYPIAITYISKLYIYPEFRDCGLGRYLLVHINRTVKAITDCPRMATAVYVHPYHRQINAEGCIKNVGTQEYHNITKAMKHVLQISGFTQIKDTYKQYSKCYVNIKEVSS